jgi:hypothetical protein
MIHQRAMVQLILPALLLALAACSPAAVAVTTPPPGPTGGWLTLQLTTPRTDDGAVQFSVNGPGIDSVKILTYNGFATADASGTNLVVTGLVTSGDIARIHVTDLNYTTSYQSTVAAAAARQSYHLQSLDGYRAVLVR